MTTRSATRGARKTTGAVRAIKASRDFDAQVQMRNYSVMYFTASWCAPCRKISPIFEELAAAQDAHVTFCKIDCDECPELCGQNQIKKMPTFQLWFGGEPVYVFEGANEDALRDLVSRAKDMARGGAAPSDDGARARD